MKKNIIKLGCLFFLILLVGVLLFKSSYSYSSVLDAGNHTSHSSSSSSSSHRSSSYRSGSSSGSTIDFKKMSLWQKVLFLIFVHGLITVFFFIFILVLADFFFKARFKKNVFVGFLMILRFVLLLVLDVKSLEFGIAFDMIGIFIFIFMVGFIGVRDNNKITRTELSVEQLKEYHLDKEVKNELYSLFLEIEKAWMNFDYVTLQRLCTDELYNQYKAQLDVYKLKNEQNIMAGFKEVRCVPFQISDDGKIVSLKVLLEVKMHDYIINTKTNRVTSGSKSTLYDMTYELIFVKSLEDCIEKCPNCGAPLQENVGTVCDYCGSQLVTLDSSWKMSEKVCLKQKNN